MTFDGEPEIVHGQHKYWKPMGYKGYFIVPYEAPDGDRSFMVGDGKQWIYQSKKLEDCGAHIDMLVIADEFNKNKKRKQKQNKRIKNAIL